MPCRDTSTAIATLAPNAGPLQHLEHADLSQASRPTARAGDADPHGLSDVGFVHFGSAGGQTSSLQQA